jgi:2-polyprenyl-3-methyl-5-hydroxy-6-metoxy-1,4-benzoquinol methylase
MPKPLIWDAVITGKFWDSISLQPEKYFTYQFGDKIAGELATHVPRAGDVLDYGCGTGFLIPHLAKQGFKVYGTDTSPESVSFVRQRFSNLTGFGGAELLDDQLQTAKKFDAVFVIEVIEHLDDLALRALHSNLRRLLSPGGVAIFTTPNEEKLEDSEVYCPVCDHTFHRWQHVRSWNVVSLRDSLATNGFAVRDVYGTNFSHRKPSGLRATLMGMLESLINPPAKPHLVAVCELGMADEA